MERAQFDFVAEEYISLHTRNIKVSGESPEFFAEYKVRDMALALGANKDAPFKLLDFGTGVGNSLPFFCRYLPKASVTGVDVSVRSLELAGQRFPGMATLLEFDGMRLPFEDAAFDHAFTANVFHHVEQTSHHGHLHDLRRVLKPGGKLFLFEHNPYNPLTRYAFESCEFDRNARMIPARRMRTIMLEAGFADVSIRYRIFFPRFLRSLRGLEMRMTWLPLGAQYCAIASREAV